MQFGSGQFLAQTVITDHKNIYIYPLPPDQKQILEDQTDCPMETQQLDQPILLIC